MRLRGIPVGEAPPACTSHTWGQIRGEEEDQLRVHASERTGTQGQRPGGPKELSPGRQPWVQKALWFAGAPAGRKKRFRRGNSPWFCRPCRGLTGAWAWFPGLGSCEIIKKGHASMTIIQQLTLCKTGPLGIISQLLAPWAKFYRPLGGLPGPLCCCRRKLSQICHAPAAGLPLLCRTPISCRVMSSACPRLFYLGSSYSPSISQVDVPSGAPLPL